MLFVFRCGSQPEELDVSITSPLITLKADVAADMRVLPLGARSGRGTGYLTKPRG
jgi:hypothetical protein